MTRRNRSKKTEVQMQYHPYKRSAAPEPRLSPWELYLSIRSLIEPPAPENAEKCRPIVELDNADQFKKVWLDCLKDTQTKLNSALYRKKLSVQRILFMKEGEGSQRTGDNQPRASRHGAIANATDPKFKAARHALESLFYILLWVAIHYNFATNTVHPSPPVLQAWISGSPQLVKRWKVLYFMEEKCGREFWPRFKNRLRR
ncbi:hypothetical protein FA15DRAFT_656382 [Coprinopsis marcescibilis]|uniref:Fungal-type protein kinase domain-containing protein n=1 Tax=Coprinopsis marcescibilis TaxID=230819 RepID=A0A5C3KTI2_COPMA|nr:hypothetical protein FA15DRAFT_656382 [Coprinopsis marcescibilis]